MDEKKVFAYTVQPGPPERTIIVSFYERYRKEKDSLPIPQLEATFFAEYLVKHLEEYQTELSQYLAITGHTDRPEGSRG
jgi:hypothetical protein